MKTTFERVRSEWCDTLEKRPKSRLFLSIAWLTLVGGVAFFWQLGSTGLVDETEPLFAEASRQMYLTGDWITPFFNGETRFDKPALTYWLQAIAFHLIGVNPWAVRLPSAIAAMVIIGFTFYTVNWYLTKEDEYDRSHRPWRSWLTAAIASAMIALSPQMIVWARTGVSDMLLSAGIASSLLCFFLAYASPEKSQAKVRWYLACYVCIALAILAKGPVGIVIPGLIILAFLLYIGEFRRFWGEMYPYWGMAIVAGLSLPWYALVIGRNGWNYIDSFFGYHNVERFTGVVNGHAAPWFFYIIVVPLAFAPYAVYLPLAIARLKFWRRGEWRSLPRWRQFGLFAFFWLAVIFVFFSIAVTKLPSYVLPSMPAVGILIALLWGDFLREKTPVSAAVPVTIRNSMGFFRASVWGNVVFVTVAGVALFYVPRILGEDPAAPDFPPLLQESGFPAIGGVIWLVSAVAIAFFRLRRHWLPIIGINLLAFLAFLLFVLTPTLFLMDAQRQLPLRQMATEIVQRQKPGEEIIMVGFKKPTVVFYSDRRVTYLRLNQDGKDYLQNWRGQPVARDSLLLLTQPYRLPKMELMPSDYEKLAEKGAYVLLRLPRESDRS